MYTLHFRHLSLLFILLFILSLPFFPTAVLSQSVGISNASETPHPSSILDVSSEEKGVLLPRMNEERRLSIEDPAEGLMVWDSTYNSLWGFDGAQWVELLPKWQSENNHIVNQNSGNVGIGETSSSYSLYIAKPNPTIGFYDTDNPGSSGWIRGDSINLEMHARRVLGLLDLDPGHLSLQTSQTVNGLPFLAGNLGVGMYNPIDKLSLNGNMGFFVGGERYGYIYPVPIEDDMVINARYGTLLQPSRDLILQTYTGTNPFNYSGNVGIGVTVPKAKLHVVEDMVIGAGAIEPAAGYALSVDGRIMAEEMRIEDSGSWPDYVFEESYALTDLDALASMISKLGHLPGVPSAEKIDEEGLMVGEMHRIQMEKIEELTLYILQLHERIASLEKQLQTQNPAK